MLDLTQGFTEISLFTGAGGGVLGTHLIGSTALAYVEWDPACQELLRKRIADGLLDDGIVHGDVREFDGLSWRGKVDVVAAGFPCQPFSVAGKQMGLDDPRNMWPATIRIIRDVQPKYAFLENVPGLLGHKSGYFGTIISDLADAGYDVVWDCIPASAVGAKHKRDRLWMVAWPRAEGGSIKRIAPICKWDAEKQIWGSLGNLEAALGTPKQFVDQWPLAGFARGGLGYALPPMSRRVGSRTGVWPEARLLDDPSVLLARLKEASQLAQDDADDASWPTPTASDGMGGPGHSGRQGGLNLRTAVAETESRMWATPLARDWKGAPGINFGSRGSSLPAQVKDQEAAQMYPTPTAFEGNSLRPGMSEKYRRPLNDAVRDLESQELWPTPVSKDTGRSPEAYREMRNDLGRDSISSLAIAAQVAEDPSLWPTPMASRNRKSKRAMTSAAQGKGDGFGQGSPPGLEQMCEFAEGIIPKELEGLTLDDLPPITRRLVADTDGVTWPTPVTNGLTAGGGTPGQMRRLIREGVDESEVRALFSRSPYTESREGRSCEVPPEEEMKSKAVGALNADWVEWLMGWPIGWTNGDPQDSAGREDWSAKTTEGSWWSAEPTGIPRLVQTQADRAKRLKACGNGQVPLCAAAAFQALVDAAHQIEQLAVLPEAEIPASDFFDL